MMIIFFNLIGLVMLAISVGTAFAVIYLVGGENETLFKFVAGPIAIVLDVSFRWKNPNGNWLFPSGGGSFLFFPVWVFGLCWLLLGLADVVTDPATSKDIGKVLVGLLFVGAAGVIVVHLVKGKSSESSFAEVTKWECSRCGHANVGRSRSCAQCHLQT